MSPGLRDRHFLTVIERLCFGRGDHPDRGQKTPVVPPVDPLEAPELDIIEPAPWVLVVDELGLEEADHGLRQGVVERVTAASHALNATGFGEAFRVADRQIAQVQ